MTKQVDSKGQIWFEQQDNLVKIGFTKSFLEDMDQCWHILPANLSKFRSKSPLLTVETNDALISIMSPVSGNFMQYSDKAQNFPDKLTEDDVVLEIGMGGLIRPEAPRAMPGAPHINWGAVAAEERLEQVLRHPDGRRVFEGAAPQAPVPQLRRNRGEF